ncbi:MAG: diguanylate cyclase [Nitrospirae bacterium]|nr:diguanylate cyclase [Nitrospirota bacterium]
MKIFYKLSTVYFIGLSFVVFSVLLAVVSFSDIYSSTGNILNLITSLSSEQRHPAASYPAAKYSIADIKAIKTRAYVFFSIALFVSSAGAFIIFYIYRKNIMNPLHLITVAIQGMTDGKFDKVPVIKSTEIGMLADKFNSMSRALEEKMQALRDAVKREQKVVNKLNLLNELNSSLVFRLNISEVMETIILFSSPLIRSEIKAVAIFNRLNHQITHFVSSLTGESVDLAVFTNNIIREFSLNHRMPVRMSSVSENDKFRGMIEGVDLGVDNFLAVPIIIDKDILGAFILINKAGETEFTDYDEDTALNISFQAAAALEKAFFHERTLELAKTDGLTGLNNHRTFHEDLEKEVQRARRSGRDLSLLLIDIDYFKKFNDAFGHQAGDSTLKELADVLNKNLRNIDSAARYGGEEFAIILPETSLAGAENTAKRISDEARNHPIYATCHKINLTVSIGVSTFPADAVDKEGLIKAADDALYMAKRSGRNMTYTYHQYKVDSAVKDIA